MPEWYAQPPLILALVLVVIGFIALIKGADIMVAGAVTIAQRFRLTPAVIGATVVAFGTSLPELMVSVFSSIKAVQLGEAGDPNGVAAIAVSNVVGSNIFNIGAVLGISALVRCLPVPGSSLRLDFPLALLSGLVLVGLSLPLGGGAEIVRWEGALLAAGLIGYVILALHMGRKDSDKLPDPVHGGMGKAVLLLIGGIALLAIGGDVTLSGGVRIAEAAGLSDRVIGLTVMAIGTSLPEMVTSIQAARRGQVEIAVANVLGSNCFNVLCIVGISAMIMPLPVNSGTLSWDYPWMIGFVLVTLPLIISGKKLMRWEGALLFGLLLTYVTLLLALPDIGS